jgi:hypothetical protein
MADLWHVEARRGVVEIDRLSEVLAASIIALYQFLQDYMAQRPRKQSSSHFPP